jgi:transcriptional regulator with XRE-family HTH domain
MEVDSIGQWVRAARERKGWTQTQLADELALSKGAISHWERGTHMPTHPQLRRIEQLTGYPLLDWPLPRIAREKFDSLSAQELDVLQDVISVTMDAIVRLRAPRASPPTGGATNPSGPAASPEPAGAVNTARFRTQPIATY